MNDFGKHESRFFLIDELFVVALSSLMVRQSDDSEIDTHIAGSHLGCCFIDPQARLSAHVWVLAPPTLRHELVVNFVFLTILKQTVNEVTNDEC